MRDDDSVGLTELAASERHAIDGPNVLPQPHVEPAWRRFLTELTHFFALLFWGAGTLAILGGMPQLGIAVFVVILLNGTFSFIQEHRATVTTQRLRTLLPRSATVVRSGVEKVVDPESIVVGDLLMLSEGDRVSADLTITQRHALAIDTSSLTGESVPTHPEPGDCVFAGTFVVEGEGRGTVVAIGGDTRIGSLARLSTQGSTASTPMRLELERVSRVIAILAVVIGAAFFTVALVLGAPASDGFLFGIGVSVALVPEGLLPTVTLSLAMGAQRMARRNALVRHLEAAETLGSTTFICTDKTGTLTRNEMTVVEIWSPSGGATIEGQGYEPHAEIHLIGSTSRADLADIAVAAARCGSGRAVCCDDSWTARGDPMEAALWSLSLRTGFDPDRHRVEHPEVARFPFDVRRRRMSVMFDDRIVVKGAPDSILPLCAPVPGIDGALHRMAGRGLRVIAIADRSAMSIPTHADDAEFALRLLALIALEDPPRIGARGAIERCRSAGIAVAMITGDHPETARAIAIEVGLQHDGDEPVLLGSELPSDDAELAALVDRDGIVIARVTPEDKLRIARSLRMAGHTVAMTGDGVNDAPALREAAIGIAMGRTGTDVARDAADLVLLDDRFETIVDAVRQGRSTFANIRRSLTYHLTANVAELAPFVVWALSAGRIPLGLGVLQILALDIGADVLPALALGVEPPSRRAMRPGANGGHLLDGRVIRRAFGVLGPIEAFVALAAFLATLLTAGWSPGHVDPTEATTLAASGAAFMSIVMGQAANAFACRSTSRPAWRVAPRQNPLLLFAVGAQFALLALFLSPLMGGLLGQAMPPMIGTAIAMLAVPAVVVADAAQKTIRRWRVPRWADPACPSCTTSPRPASRCANRLRCAPSRRRTRDHT